MSINTICNLSNTSQKYNLDLSLFPFKSFFLHGIRDTILCVLSGHYFTHCWAPYSCRCHLFYTAGFVLFVDEHLLLLALAVFLWPCLVFGYLFPKIHWFGCYSVCLICPLFFTFITTFGSFILPVFCCLHCSMVVLFYSLYCSILHLHYTPILLPSLCHFLHCLFCSIWHLHWLAAFIIAT